MMEATLPGGIEVQLTDDEWIVYQAYLLVRKGNKGLATINRVASVIRFRLDGSYRDAHEWLSERLEPMLDRGIFTEQGESELVAGTGNCGGNGRARRRRAIIRQYGSHCAYCAVSIEGNRVTLDHVTPKSRGGVDGIENIRPCCPECNQSKRDRTPEEWANDIRRVGPRRRNRFVAIAATALSVAVFWR